MPRIKRSVHAKKKRREILEAAKGYYGARSRRYRVAKEQVMHSGVYAYRDRRDRKAQFRRLWITRIGAASRMNGLPYGRFIHGLGGSGRAEPTVTAARSAGIPVHPVSDEVMEALTSTVTPQGVVAVAAFLDRSVEDAIAPGARCVPVLIHVRDPGNAGTILRSADAAGADAVVFARASVDVYNPKVVRASAGSLFHVPVVRDAEPAAA